MIIWIHGYTECKLKYVMWMEDNYAAANYMSLLIKLTATSKAVFLVNLRPYIDQKCSSILSFFALHGTCLVSRKFRGVHSNVWKTFWYMSKFWQFNFNRVNFRQLYLLAIIVCKICSQLPQHATLITATLIVLLSNFYWCSFSDRTLRVRCSERIVFHWLLITNIYNFT